MRCFCRRYQVSMCIIFRNVTESVLLCFIFLSFPSTHTHIKMNFLCYFFACVNNTHRAHALTVSQVITVHCIYARMRTYSLQLMLVCVQCMSNFTSAKVCKRKFYNEFIKRCRLPNFRQLWEKFLSPRSQC